MPYAKPPEHSRFKKGQSGNPSGRPRKVPTFIDDLLDELQLLAPAGGTCSNQRAIVKTLVAAARDGHFSSTGLIVSQLASVQRTDDERSDEATTIAEADILDHVRDQTLAEGDGSAGQGGDSEEGGDDGAER